MTFTKVTNTGIGSTGTVLLQNLDVIGIATAGFGVSTVDVFTTGITTFANATDSTSTTTGSVIVSGGVGIAKTLNVGEDVVAFASSDERYKDNIIPIRNPNEKIKQIGGYTFDWNDKHEVFKGKKDIGVIAQEVEKEFPELVSEDKGIKSVAYGNLVAVAFEAIKELKAEVDTLREEIRELKGE